MTRAKQWSPYTCLGGWRLAGRTGEDGCHARGKAGMIVVHGPGAPRIFPRASADRPIDPCKSAPTMVANRVGEEALPVLPADRPARGIGQPQEHDELSHRQFRSAAGTFVIGTIASETASAVNRFRIFTVMTIFSGSPFGRGPVHHAHMPTDGGWLPVTPALRHPLVDADLQGPRPDVRAEPLAGLRVGDGSRAT